MAFSFDIKGLDALKKSLAARPEKTKAAVKGVLADHVTKINKEQKERAYKMTDRGALLAGIDWVPVPGDGIDFLLFSQAPYSAYREFGTGKQFRSIAEVDASQYRGGTGQTGLYAAILAWVKRKGIAQGTTYSTGVTKQKGGGFGYDPSKARRKRTGKKVDAAEKAAAFAIYKSILKNGTKPQPFFFEPFLSRRGQIKDDILKAINNIK